MSAVPGRHYGGCSTCHRDLFKIFVFCVPANTVTARHQIQTPWRIIRACISHQCYHHIPPVVAAIFLNYEFRLPGNALNSSASSRLTKQLLDTTSINPCAQHQPLASFRDFSKLRISPSGDHGPWLSQPKNTSIVIHGSIRGRRSAPTKLTDSRDAAVSLPKLGISPSRNHFQGFTLYMRSTPRCGHSALSLSMLDGNMDGGTAPGSLP